MFWTGCALCKRIRLYLTVAVPLVIMLGLRPESAQRLAALMPSAEMIGYGIVGLGALEFIRRWVVWRKSSRQ